MTPRYSVGRMQSAASALRIGREEGRKNFFFEKKKQKTFDFSWPQVVSAPVAQIKQKFFASFFQKRSSSLLSSK